MIATVILMIKSVTTRRIQCHHSDAAVSNRREIDCLFNSTCSPRSKQTSKLIGVGPLWIFLTKGQWPLVTPAKFPCHVMTSSWNCTLQWYNNCWNYCHGTLSQCQKLGKIVTGLTLELLLSFMVISDVYGSFITNKSTFTKCGLTQWILKLHSIC